MKPDSKMVAILLGLMIRLPSMRSEFNHVVGLTSNFSTFNLIKVESKFFKTEIVKSASKCSNFHTALATYYV